MAELCDLSLSQLHQLYRERKASPSEVVQSHIQRIEKENPRLNALVVDRFDQARLEAKKLDAQLMQTQDELPHVFGLPFTTKEMIQVDTLPHTLGLVRRKGVKAQGTATVISRLQKQGAILLGLSNVPELGLWFESQNEIYGRTHNPYDIKRTAGGSSGGEGALVAVHGSSFGVGSDVGGSIRIPAFFCGLAGHKPSNRMVPMTGHPPVTTATPHESMGAAYPVTVIGPLACEARDLRPLMLALAGPDGLDTEIATDEAIKKSLEFRQTNWREIKVFTLESPFIPLVTSTEKSLRDCVQKAAEVFASRGCLIEELPRNLFIRAFEMWMAAVGNVKGSRLSDKARDEGPEVQVFKEFLQFIRGTPNHTLPILTMLALEKFRSDRRTEKMYQELLQFRQRFYNIIGSQGILLMPPHPRAAPNHKAPFFRPFDFVYTAIFNALEMPASVVPMGQDDKGLPIGVQIAALPFADGLVLSASELLESELQI